jgi:hypothetical protein
MFMRFQGGGIGHKGMLERIAGLQNKEQPLSTADMNEDLDSEIVEGLGDNDDDDDDEEEEESDFSDESDDSFVDFDLDGDEGGEDEYDILGFAAF